MAYTDFLQLVQARQSDRSYDKERPVEPEKLERVLEAARLAPSACNAQPWKFVVVTDKELSNKVGKLPHFLVVYNERLIIWKLILTYHIYYFIIQVKIPINSEKILVKFY